jgi:outer membrane lipoprotein SlyB
MPRSCERTRSGQNRTSTQEQAAKVAAGAAAGAILGRVLGQAIRGRQLGCCMGAAAGTAIAMGTTDVDVVLPQGSEMVIRLDSPIRYAAV